MPRYRGARDSSSFRLHEENEFILLSSVRRRITTARAPRETRVRGGLLPFVEGYCLEGFDVWRPFVES